MSDIIIQFIFNGLFIGSLYSLVAIGFSLIYNTTKIFHFAHACAFTLTAYFFYSIYFTFNFPLIVAFITSLFAAAIFGLLMNIVLYEPLEKRKSSSLVIILSSLAFYIVVTNFLAIIYSNEPKPVITKIQNIYTYGQISITQIQLIVLLASLFVSFGFLLILHQTDFGKIVRAMRDNGMLLTVIGFDLKILRYSIFAIGTALVGLAAVLSAIDVGIDPHIGMPIFIMAVVATIIGGISNFQGAILGSYLVGILQSLSSLFFPTKWRELIIFIILIIFLVFRPQGILGSKKRLEENK